MTLPDIPLPGVDPEENKDSNPIEELIETIEEDSSIKYVDTSNGKENGLDKCPDCGAADVQIYNNTQLICVFCRNIWTPELIDNVQGLTTPLKELKGMVIGGGSKDIDLESSSILTIQCNACAAEIVINTDGELSQRCHWCRNVLTINNQIPNGAVPDAILPCILTKEEAVEKLHEYAGKKETFAHPQFKKEFVPENVMLVYLPYMMIDANLEARLSGKGEIETRRYTVSVDHGDNEKKETRYDSDEYSIERRFSMIVDDLQLESSSDKSNMNTRVNSNNVINAILPFDTKEAVKFNANFLQNATSEKRNLDIEAIKPRLEDSLLTLSRHEALNTIKQYDRGVRWDGEAVNIHGVRWVSIYLPVWLYSYMEEVEGKEPFIHYIAVNGRNGKAVGSIPVNKGKLALISTFVGIGGAIVGGIAAALGMG